MPQIYDMGPTALLPFRRKVCWGFFRPKNPTASAGFEPANLGTKGQHATPRPLKPLLQYKNIISISHTIIKLHQSHYTILIRLCVIFTYYEFIKSKRTVYWSYRLNAFIHQTCESVWLTAECFDASSERTVKPRLSVSFYQPSWWQANVCVCVCVWKVQEEKFMCSY